MKDDLPVSEEIRQKLLDFSIEKQKSGNLVVLGGIPDILRHDYLNLALPLPDRAIKNVEIRSSAWRLALGVSCSLVAQATLCLTKDRRRVAVCYPWRAGLAFATSFFRHNVGKHLHVGLRRDENRPHKTAEVYLPLSLSAFGRNFNGEFDQVIIADPMLATGGSFVTVIDQLLEFGVPEEKIMLASIITAPEGVYNLLHNYHKIKIITASLDSHLNELGYIQPGLGDAGDKFFDGLSLDDFKPIAAIFSSEEWKILREKINGMKKQKNNKRRRGIS